MMWLSQRQSPIVPSVLLPVRVIAALVLVSAAGAAGCTSFAFKNTGKGTAPSELKDPSKMIPVEGRVYEMGALNAEPDEFPPHKVEVNSFLMDKTEVTRADYKRCVDARVCRPAIVDKAVLAATTPEHPVTGVSWYDAVKYCEWVGKRLPTEAEWELAARAPRFGRFPFETAFGPDVVNSRGEQDGFARTAPVGSFVKGASGLGLFDMAGNAAEWTADWYEATWYQKSPARNPKGPEEDTGTKVVRGGSWSDPEHLVRTTARLAYNPNLSNDAVGFRCAAGRTGDFSSRVEAEAPPQGDAPKREWNP